MQNQQNQDEEILEQDQKYQFQFGQHKNQIDLKLKSQLTIDHGDVFSIRFDQEDQMLAVGTSDGNIQLFKDCKIINQIKQDKLQQNLESYQTPITSLRWRPNIGAKAKGILVSANAEGHILHWHAQSGKQLNRIIEQNNSILCLDFNFDGSLFATAGKDFCIRIYDDDIKSVSHTFQQADWGQRGHSNRVFSLKFLPDQPQILISGGWDSNILIWDVREKKCVGQFYGPSLSSDSLDYSIKRQQLLTGSHRTDHQLQLWDWRTRNLCQEIEWTGKQCEENKSFYIFAAQFCKTNDDYIYAGSSGVHEIKLFNLKDGQPKASIIKLPKSVLSIDQMNSENSIAFSGIDGLVNIFKVF